MGQPVEITRTSLTASELRGQAVKIKEGTVVRRVLAIALLLEGHSRDAAACMNGMTRQTLRDWVHHYNAEGVAGLWSRTGTGRPPVLTNARMEELKAIVTGSVSYRAIEWIRWTRPVPRSRRFEDAECDDATGKETMTAGVGWNVPATA
jgi:hypothetical protein